MILVVLRRLSVGRPLKCTLRLHAGVCKFQAHSNKPSRSNQQQAGNQTKTDTDEPTLTTSHILPNKKKIGPTIATIKPQTNQSQ
jgi:hypothetical protein